ncbi:MAG: hypothetical protein ACJ8J0_21075 [Longimicrobiaceae bacterium]
MIAWILSRGRLPYIAAIFDDRDAAERYLGVLPEAVRGASSVAWRADLSLPCYFAEDEAGFQALSEAEARSWVAALSAGEADSDGAYGILYRIEAPFLPAVAGGDEMGRLPHVHLEAHHLAAAAQAGIAALWERLRG